MGLLRGFLEGIGEVVEALSARRETRLDPAVFFLASLAMTSASALSPHPWMWLASALYAAILWPIARPSARLVLRVYTVLAPLAAVPGLPLLFFGGGKGAPLAPVPLQLGAWQFAAFSARVLASPLPLVAALSSAGWAGVSSGLMRLRPLRGPLALVNASLAATRFLLRSATWMLAARESRLVAGGRGLERLVASSVAGDLLYQAVELSKRMSMAYRARCVSGC